MDALGDVVLLFLVCSKTKVVSKFSPQKEKENFDQKKRKKKEN